jgi:hypothetical protein
MSPNLTSIQRVLKLAGKSNFDAVHLRFTVFGLSETKALEIGHMKLKKADMLFLF